MKIIKSSRIIIACLAVLSVCQCQELPSQKIRFDFALKEDDGAAVSDAEVTFTFGRIPESDQVVHTGISDKFGKFTVEDDVVFGLLYTIRKNGYYSIYERDPLKSITLEQYNKLRHMNIDVTMRQIKKPIPLYGRVVKRAFPEQNLPIGYDLQAADWVKPHGKGIVTDLLFSFNRKHLGCKNGETYEEIISRLVKRHEATPRAKANFLGAVSKFHENNISYDYLQAVQHTAGHWRGAITVTFPNPKEGIREVKDEFKHYSELTMPHQAPTDGYQSEWKRVEDNEKPRQTSDRVGYFLRTRVKLDEKGEIVSAHYAKLVTDFNFDPRGRITFSYLFNPTANDRNLEFDPKKNLFKNLEIGEEIQKP